jgi:hypothetical protein
MADAKDREDGAEHDNTHNGPKPVPLHDPERLLDDMNKEYYAIVDVVSGFDQRIMVIKGWSVTLSLVGLGLGFQQGHYVLFALAAATALAFWFLETLTKQYQILYYGRMRDIEVAALRLNNVELGGTVLSAPRIDWSWAFKGDPRRADWRNDPPTQRSPKGIRRLLRLAPWFPNVMLPHVVAVILGVVLFVAAMAGVPGLDTLKP